MTRGAPNRTAEIRDAVPKDTREWLLSDSNPAVAVLARKTIWDEADGPATQELWGQRNGYAPVAAILGAMRDDGSWDVPSRDYQKYRGSLWQIHLLGELWADGSDERVRRAADYAFSRQLDDGSWSCNGRPAASIPCLTSNVGRALARLGYADDPRVIAALEYCSRLFGEVGALDCREGATGQLNGYCHMLAPKTLLFLAQVPVHLWPEGAVALRDECVSKLRDKRIFRCLPEESREFQDRLWSAPASERAGMREAFLAEHPQLHYKEKPGWMRFGYPLSYNSDTLEALAALAGIGEEPRAEYAEAVETVRNAADGNMRWRLRNTLNGKMFGDVEAKGEPSRWLTLRALQVLLWDARGPSASPRPA